MRELAQPGDLALRCRPYGLAGWNQATGRWDANYGYDANGIECVLPLISPPRVEGPPWIEGALAGVRVDGAPLPMEGRGVLAGTLDPRRLRQPAYEPAGLKAGNEMDAAIGALRRRKPGSSEDYEPAVGRMVHREPVEQDVKLIEAGATVIQFRTTRWARHDRPHGQRRGLGRNATRPLRDVLVAVAWDLMDCRVDEVGEVLLGTKPDSRRYPDASRDPSRAWRGHAYDVRRRGRSILAQLGCWPWAIAPSGMLPRTWRRQDPYLDALNRWLCK